MPILEAGEKLEYPNAGGVSKPKGKTQVSKKDMEGVKADFQGLVSDGMDLDVALEEAIQAHLPVVVEDEISGGSDLQAMYHTLEEVPDANPQLYGGNSRARARTSTKELIKKHLEALALYPEAELEAALADEEDGASVNQDSDGESDMSISANGEVEGPAPVEIDEDEQEDLIVWSKRYKQALTGAKVHDTAMQTSKLGGKEVPGAAKAKANTGTLGSAVLK